MSRKVYQSPYEHPSISSAYFRVILESGLQQTIYTKVMRELFGIKFSEVFEKTGSNTYGEEDSINYPKIITNWYIPYKSKAAFSRGEEPMYRHPHVMGDPITNTEIETLKKDINVLTFSEFLNSISGCFNLGHHDLIVYILKKYMLEYPEKVTEKLTDKYFETLLEHTILVHCNISSKLNHILNSTPVILNVLSGERYTILGSTVIDSYEMVYYNTGEEVEVVTGEEHPEYEKYSYFTTERVLGKMEYVKVVDLIPVPEYRGLGKNVYVDKYQLLK